jgi:Ca-activated chloride channel family protein
MAALGVAQIATIDLQYVELPGLVEHSVQLPISVNVVPGDEAARRVPDPTVRTEVLFQEAQTKKRLASESFERGDAETGRALLDESVAGLESAFMAAPPEVAGDIRAELEEVRGFSARSHDLGAAHTSKLTRDSYHRQNRKRGRRPSE